MGLMSGYSSLGDYQPPITGTFWTRRGRWQHQEDVMTLTGFLRPAFANWICRERKYKLSRTSTRSLTTFRLVKGCIGIIVLYLLNLVKVERSCTETATETCADGLIIVFIDPDCRRNSPRTRLELPCIAITMRRDKDPFWWASGFTIIHVVHS